MHPLTLTLPLDTVTPEGGGGAGWHTRGGEDRELFIYFFLSLLRLLLLHSLE